MVMCSLKKASRLLFWAAMLVISTMGVHGDMRGGMEFVGYHAAWAENHVAMQPSDDQLSRTGSIVLRQANWLKKFQWSLQLIVAPETLREVTPIYIYTTGEKPDEGQNGQNTPPMLSIPELFPDTPWYVGEVELNDVTKNWSFSPTSQQNNELENCLAERNYCASNKPILGTTNTPEIKEVARLWANKSELRNFSESSQTALADSLQTITPHDR